MAVVLAAKPYGLLGRAPSIAADHARSPSSARWWCRRAARAALAALAALALAALLPFASDEYTLVLATDVLVFALFAASLQFMMGTGGMASFGHAAYFGLGAYARGARRQARRVDGGARWRWRPLAALAGAARLRLVLRAAVGRLPGDADARLRADRVVRSPSSGTPSPAARTGWSASGRPHGSPTSGRITGSRWPSSRHGAGSHCLDRAFAVRLRAARGARFAAAGGSAGHRRAAHPVDARSRSPVPSPASPAVSTRSRRAASRRKRLPFPRSVDALVMVLLGGLNALAGPLVGAAAFTWLSDSLAARHRILACGAGRRHPRSSCSCSRWASAVRSIAFGTERRAR